MTPKIPDDVMRETFTRELPYHPAWPLDYSKAIADPVIAAILRTLARHVPAYRRRDSDRAAVGLAPLHGRPQAAPQPTHCTCPVGTCSGGVVNGINLAGERCRVNGADSVPGTPRNAAPVYPDKPRPPVLKKQPGLDFKSRAAGEREDE
jgi:hypothetical protein